jgi:protein-disulfide isomerase
VSSRRQQREAARVARLEREAQAVAHAARRRRLTLLGVAAGVAAAATVVAVVVSSGGAQDKPMQLATGAVPAGVAEVAARFAGIPQHNLTLGSPSARVTMEEYADLKCPICREYTVGPFPTLVARYLRTSKLKTVFQPQTFVGQPPGNSALAARFALAAGLQNKLWQFVDLFYINQKDETTPYVTDAFVKQIGSGVQGLDVDKALREANTSPVVERELREAGAAFRAHGFSGTPSFVLGRTGGTLKPLDITALDAGQFTDPIDRLLKA